MTPVIRTRGLTKRYEGVAAVDGLDLQVERGELYGFLGPNGAGKTTTIRMALGLIHATSGEVEVLGEPVSIDRGPLRRVGALVEEPAFWRYLSGRRNLEYFARAGGRGDDTRRRLSRVDECLAAVGLVEAGAKRVKAYSQGMRQRLGIANALLGEPELLMLDEPTNGLDPSGMREVRLLLRQLVDGGTTVFVSSHLLSEVEAMCDRVGVMAQGRIVAEGAPGTLRGLADRLRVEVDDLARATEVVRGLAGATVAEPSTPGSGAGALTIELGGDLVAAEVNRALVTAGVRVSALVPVGDTLEDVFLHLVEGADVPR
ncbi:MAG: ABC transporter ATP-binding protein [Actinomycetota bacterium]